MAISVRSGGYMSANQGVGQSTLTQCSINTADSGFPYTGSFSGGGLVVLAPGPIAILGQVSYDNSISGTATLKINGTQAAVGTLTANATTVRYAYVAQRGDVITLWETDNGTNNFVQHALGGATNTFIHFEALMDLAPMNSSVYQAAYF